MLNWLKSRVRKNISAKYLDVFRRNPADKMLVCDQGLIANLQKNSVKLTILNENEEEYSLDVSLDTSVEALKHMAVMHFLPTAAMASSHQPEEASSWNFDWVNGQLTADPNDYKLLHLSDCRPLCSNHDRSLLSEKIVNNDILLLVSTRRPPPNWGVLGSADNGSEGPTLEDIRAATAHLPPASQKKVHVIKNQDVKIILRRIYLSLISVSVYLISPQSNSLDVFVFILEQLENRHRPRVDKSALKQLRDMGFQEDAATRALQMKHNIHDAAEYLVSFPQGLPEEMPPKMDFLSLSPKEKKNYFLCENLDGTSSSEWQSLTFTSKVIRRFREYVVRKFQPDQAVLAKLKKEGFEEDVIIHALRVSCNHEGYSRKILKEPNHRTLLQLLDESYPRNSSIMQSILESSRVQLHLAKTKTLYAFVALCENSVNTSLWMGDTDLHPVLEHILKVQNDEKYSQNNSESDLFNMEQVKTSATSSGRPENSQEVTVPYQRSPSSSASVVTVEVGSTSSNFMLYSSEPDQMAMQTGQTLDSSHTVS